MFLLLITMTPLTTPFLRSEYYRPRRTFFAKPSLTQRDTAAIAPDANDALGTTGSDMEENGGELVFGDEGGGGGEGVDNGFGRRRDFGTGRGLFRNNHDKNTWRKSYHSHHRTKQASLLDARTALAAAGLDQELEERQREIERQKEKERGFDPYYYSPEASRQASLMMAAANPRIGVRSSLVRTPDSCIADPVRLTILPPPKFASLCRPTTEISFGCRGGCSSYTHVDTRNATNLISSCRSVF